MKTKLANLVCILLLFVTSVTVRAQQMSSPSYSIERDSINFGGGFSSSASFSQESSFGENATGRSQSSSFTLQAGYQQMDEAFISVSVSGNVTLSPAIDGSAGGVANGSADVTVITTSSAGYALYIQAESSPAFTSGPNNFTDYTTVGGDPDLVFSVVNTDSEFGFSPEGSDIVTRYRDDGSDCNVDVQDTVNACWDGLSTSNVLIAQSATANNPTGTVTTLKFRAESGTSNVQPAGLYTATTTVTAVAL